MMKKLAVSAACFGLLAVAGCSTISSNVNKFEDFVTSPKTQATVAILAKATVVFICDVSAVSNIAGQIEVASGAGKSLIGTNGKLYAASSVACTGLGGLLDGTARVPAGTPVVQ